MTGETRWKSRDQQAPAQHSVSIEHRIGGDGSDGDTAWIIE